MTVLGHSHIWLVAVLIGVLSSTATAAVKSARHTKRHRPARQTVTIPDPLSLQRASVLLTAGRDRLASELCDRGTDAGKLKNTITLRDRLSNFTDALDALQAGNTPTSIMRTSQLAQRFRGDIPRPADTLDAKLTGDVVLAASRWVLQFMETPKAAIPDGATPPAPATKKAETPGPTPSPRVNEPPDLRELLRRLDETINAKIGSKACDKECVTYVREACTMGVGEPPDERVPATGGIAWTVRAILDTPSGEHRADPVRATYLFQKYERDCADKQVAGNMPSSCRVVRTLGGASRSFPGVLFAAASRSDLEALPAAAVGTPAARALLALMRRVRSGDPPLGLLSGLPESMTTPSTDEEVALRRAGLLVSLFGDVLAISDLGALERALPVVSRDIRKYLEICAGEREPRPICDLRSTTMNEQALARVGREIYLLNELAQGGVAVGDTNVERGYRILSATLRVLDSAMHAVAASTKDREAAMASWRRTHETGQATALMLAGRYPEGALMLSGLDARTTSLLPVAVSVATQQTPLGVAAALDTAADRVSIWDLRTAGGQLTVTGLLGLGATWDRPAGARTGVEPTIVGSLTASAGISFSFPVSSTYISLYAPMLDVGQLAATPVVKTEGQRGAGASRRKVSPTTTTDLKLAQVLAPGVYLGAALPRSSLVIACGFSVTPQLRQYELRNADDVVVGSELYSVTRMGCHMGLDLPFVEFL